MERTDSYVTSSVAAILPPCCNQENWKRVFLAGGAWVERSEQRGGGGVLNHLQENLLQNGKQFFEDQGC